MAKFWDKVLGRKDDGPKPVAESLMEQRVSITEAAAFLMTIPELSEAYTQADIELALDDRGWLTGGQKVAGELDPLSRSTQINKTRYYWLRDPLARQACRLWTDYALGAEGLQYNCDEDTTQQKAIDKFMKDRRNRKLLSAAGMKRLSTRLLVDGEIFFAMFEDGTIRTFDPLQITNIVCKADDDETTLVYVRKTTGKDQETLYYKDWAADDKDAAKAKDPITGELVGTKIEKSVVVYHLPFEPFEKRGTGLLSSCVNWSREHRRFMEARVAITQALSTWAHKVTVKGGQSKLNKVRDALQSTFAVTGTQNGTERVPQNAPASAFIQNDGIDMVPTPRATGASDSKSDADQLKLMVCAGTGLGIHYFGDNATGNLATSTAMELPMLKAFMGYQKLWIDAFRDLFTILLQIGPDEDPLEIDLSMPEILATDLGKLGTFLTSATNMFPELKVPAIIRMILVSANVPDVDDVMEDIEDKREEIDQQTADNASKGIMTDKNGRPVVVPQGDPAKPGVGGAGNGPQSTDQSEALAEAMREIARKLP